MLEHQRSAVLQILEGKRALVHPYGLGKTWSVLKGLELLLQDALPPHFIVVFCKPRNIPTWKTEIELRIPEALSFGISGTARQRELSWEDISTAYDNWPALKYPFAFILIGYPTLQCTLLEILNRLAPLPLHALVADESTRIKTPKTSTTKAALAVAKRYPTIPKIVMTGNMKPEGDHEVWSQFEFTGKNPFRCSYYQFLSRWFVRPPFGSYVLELGKEKDFCALLEKEGIWISPKDYETLRDEIGIPLEQRVVEYYALSKEQQKLLEYLYENWSLPSDITFEQVMNEEFDSSFPVEMNYVISLNNKAQEICSGFYYNEQCKTIWLIPFEDNPKVQLLISIMQDLFKENPNRKVIVWRKYKAEDTLLLYALAEYNPILGLEADNIQNFLRKKEYPVLIMPVDCSEGFNELVVADTDIYFSNTFSQEKRTQAEARIARLGQKAPVVIHIDISSGEGRDQEVIHAIQNKTLNVAKLQEITHKYFKYPKE